MAATRDWADELTKQNRGKHHMGDFLPPEELAKFMETYQVRQLGQETGQVRLLGQETGQVILLGQETSQVNQLSYCW